MILWYRLALSSSPGSERAVLEEHSNLCHRQRPKFGTALGEQIDVVQTPGSAPRDYNRRKVIVKSLGLHINQTTSADDLLELTQT